MIGERIKRIRTFRGITQKELGLKIGYDEKSADVRIAQYESNYRVPKKDTILQIAEALDINYVAISANDSGSAEDIMQTLFWLDEQNDAVLNLFEFKPASKTNGTFDTNEYNIASPLIGITIEYGLVNDFLHEWMKRKTELKNGEISRNEYFEWKINWPRTCDDCGNVEPSKNWRSEPL